MSDQLQLSQLGASDARFQVIAGNGMGLSGRLEMSKPFRDQGAVLTGPVLELQQDDRTVRGFARIESGGLKAQQGT